MSSAAAKNYLKYSCCILRPVIPLFLLLFSGCTFLHAVLPGSHPTSTVMIKDVPFTPQTYNQCGPSSLVTLFSFWGKDIPLEEIASQVYSPQLNGTLLFDMERFAASQGFHAETYNGSIDDLEERLSNGYPLILFLDRGILNLKIGHYTVVFGFNHDDRYVLANWGDEQEKVITYSQLGRLWEKTNFLTLLVYIPQ